ncbi:ATP-binding protein [Mangrovibacterium sp.]|uniref:ATP-binding protein n=1 Tax=Mangrovibacterium sp. TaxID=1961364 RepID=UPI003562A0EE
MILKVILFSIALSLHCTSPLYAADSDGQEEIRRKIQAINQQASAEAQKKEFARSCQIGQTALELSLQNGLLDEAALSNAALASNYLNLGNSTKAIDHLLEAVRINKKLGKQNNSTELHKKLSDLMLQTGNYIQAIEHLRLYEHLKDSIEKQNSEHIIAVLEKQFSKEINQSEKRLVSIQKEKQDENTIFAFVALTLLVLGATAFAIAIQKHLQVKHYLMRLNEQQDRMFSLIGHGLRGPIGSVKGIFDLITEQDIDDPKELKSILSESREVVDSSFNLLENLLNWSKSQTGNLIVSPQKISIGSLVKENLSLFTSSIKHKNFTIENHVDDNHYAYADLEMVNIVVRNVLSNSVKFTRTNGKISFHSQITNKHLLLTVADTGIGISSKKIEEIMADCTIPIGQNEANIQKGRGIGLKICNDFLQKNNGKLSIVSFPNKGSKFIIHLPIGS